MNRNHLAPIGVLCATMFVGNDAYAYVDPGTGTMLIQWLFGMAMASFAVLSVYWQQAKRFVSRMFGSASSAQAQESGEEVDNQGRD